MLNRRAFAAVAFALAGLGPAAALASEGKKEGPPASEFVDLPTLTASVIQPSGQRGVMTVQAVLYIPNAAQSVKAAKSMPLLLNAYITPLQAWAYTLPPGAAPNVETLALSLQTATDKVLGRGTRLLLGGVMIN